MAAYTVIVTVLLLILALYSSWARPTFVFLAAILVFLATGILSPQDVLDGLSNKQVALVFLLVMLVGCFRKAFGNRFFTAVFKPTLKPKQFLGRMMLSVCAISPFINNTPIVAFMIPYVKEWLDERSLPVSKYMMPLCFATVLAGMTTVIGTSSNLVLAGLINEAGLPALNYKDFLFPGLAVTITGVAYLYTLGWRLLPSKKSATAEMEDNIKEYVVETVVQPQSHFVGETITSARLRNLKDIYLFGINRNAQTLSPVEPTETICEGDHLFFSGRTAAIAQLMKNGNGLTLPDATELVKHNHRNCVEAIVPASSSLVGKKVKETDFRRRFHATIIALHREGRRLHGSVGDTELAAGDLLLLLGAEGMKPRADLFLLSHPDVEILSSKQSVWGKAVSLCTLLLLVLGIVGVMDLFVAALVSILLFLGAKTATFRDLRTAFDPDLAVLLVASLAIGLALTKSGAAQLVTTGLLGLAGNEPRTALLLLFCVTVLITAVVTNAAAVAIVFPLAVSLASRLHLATAPVFVAIAFASTCVFVTPIGYQCNLMVYGPGAYSVRDFFRVGLPLTVLYGAVCLAFIFWYYNL